MVSVEEALEFWETHIRCIREEFDRMGFYHIDKEKWIDGTILRDLEEGLIVLKEAFNVYI